MNPGTCSVRAAAAITPEDQCAGRKRLDMDHLEVNFLTPLACGHHRAIDRVAELENAN